MTKKQKKTGTTTVCVKCEEGIVFAADKRASAGNLVVNREADKIKNITDDIAVTTSGSVSSIQRMLKLIKAETKLNTIRNEKALSVKEVANLLGQFLYTRSRKLGSMAHFLLGGKDEDGFHLYDLFPTGSVTKVSDYKASGSGSVMAYGVLDNKFEEGMSLDEAIQLAVDAVNAGMQRDTASGNGIDVAKVTEDGFEDVAEKKLEEKVELKKK